MSEYLLGMSRAPSPEQLDRIRSMLDRMAERRLTGPFDESDQLLYQALIDWERELIVAVEAVTPL